MKNYPVYLIILIVAVYAFAAWAHWPEIKAFDYKDHDFQTRILLALIAWGVWRKK